MQIRNNSAGGAHRLYGFDYVLPHDIGANGNNQDNWRFCDKCKALFFDGYQDKGRCPVGAGHNAAGYMFVLPHDLAAQAPAPQQELRLHANVTTDGWAPIGGWVELIARPGGGCEFAGHIHNSGAINIRFTLGAVLVTPKGYSYGFAMSNKRVDGTEVLIGRNRDFDWRNNGDWAHWLDRVNGYHIGTARYAADYWPDVSKSVIAWKLVASSSVGSGVTSFLENIVLDAYRALPNLAGTKELLVGRPLQLVLSL